MEDKIEVGEYVKTKEGRIAQIKSIDYEAKIYRFDRIIYINDFRMKEDVLYSNEMFKKLIVKHSKQLIDLIEVGDFVNGMKILHIEDNKLYVEWDNEFDEFTGFLKNKNIETILTKEQYIAISYIVGGEDESN